MFSKKYAYLDSLYSEFIRKRAIATVGGCERCLTSKKDWKQLQASHFHGRARKSVRWDEDNGAGLCGACHMYFTANPYEHTIWFENHLGGAKFELLAGRSGQIGKPDKVALEIYLRDKIKLLEVDNES